MAVNHKDTYKASAIFLIVMGILYLVDKLIGFASYGLPWVMQKDNLLLYAAVIFLWFKTDKSVGIVFGRHLVNIEYWSCDSFAGTNVCLSVAGSFVDYRSDFIFGFYPMIKNDSFDRCLETWLLIWEVRCVGQAVMWCNGIQSGQKSRTMELADKLSAEYTVSVVVFGVMPICIL